jgi:hypothetical protein
MFDASRQILVVHAATTLPQSAAAKLGAEPVVQPGNAPQAGA